MKEHTLIKRWQDTLQELSTAVHKAGRAPGSVSLVAVSKLHPAARVRVLAEAGQLDFGENYVQEAQLKQHDLADFPLRWHFIGRLQTNKARFVAGAYHLVHTVDSLKLARALHKRAQTLGVSQPVLLQVNLAGEKQKGGVPEAELPFLVESVLELSHLELQGLMTMPPYFEDPGLARPLFARLRRIKERLETMLDGELPHLSMGMTQDFAFAVEEGSTLVRIGTRIFGPRPRK